MDLVYTGRPLPISSTSTAADEWIQGLFCHTYLDLNKFDGGNMWVMNRNRQNPFEGPWVKLVEMKRDQQGLYVYVEFLLYSGPDWALEARRRAAFAIRADA